jgi:hypothetical protein
LLRFCVLVSTSIISEEAMLAYSILVGPNFA